MRRRLYAVVAVAALGLAMPGHAEEPKKLDGDKSKKLEYKVTAEQQFHDEELVTAELGLSDDRMACQPPRCARYDFVFAPAAGTTGDLVVHSKWSAATSDLDVYLIDAAGKQVEACASFGGSGEIFAVKIDKLTKDAKYTVIVDFFRTTGEEVTTTIEYPATFAEGTSPLGLIVGDCATDG